MLSEEERRDIEREAPNYATRKALCIDALRIVQGHRGYVSDQALQEVADYLGLPLSHVEGVATFYNLIFRHPVGARVILVCDSVSCWIMGCERLLDRLRAHLETDVGGTSPDGRYTLLTAPCLGACDFAPVLMIGETLHRDVTAETLPDLLGKGG
ncbi:MAG: NADH-quinone oxidoreductase subunit NuoE [Betaproteobacteria bacterium]|nr:NADH-quinone oxidoreductase subunit NuoE [Betaproteobacteria bacterium]